MQAENRENGDVPHMKVVRGQAVAAPQLYAALKSATSHYP